MANTSAHDKLREMLRNHNLASLSGAPIRRLESKGANEGTETNPYQILLRTGEIYVGCIGDVAGNLHHTILLPGDSDEAPWSTQMEWAKSIGGALPNRIEQAMLWANHRDQFQKDWYWSNEQHHFGFEWVWCQNFDDGNQLDHLRYFGFCARAVRRVVQHNPLFVFA